MSPTVSRLALAAAALAAAVVLAAGLRDVLRPRPALAFVERAEPAGFRDLMTAERAAASVPLVPASAGAPGAAPDICAALFADPDDARLGRGEPVVVYFNDYRCPYCRVVGSLLFERAAADEITLIVKEWPILGPASEAGARLALAAARQEAHAPAYARLAGSAFVPTPAYAAAVAADLGLDPARLAADMDGPEVADQLARTAALAEALGLAGTPGLVVGRTVAKRSVREPLLDRLIAEERRSGPAPC